MGDVLVARWWTKVLASDFGVFTCFGGLQSRLQSHFWSAKDAFCTEWAFLRVLTAKTAWRLFGHVNTPKKHAQITRVITPFDVFTRKDSLACKNFCTPKIPFARNGRFCAL